MDYRQACRCANQLINSLRQDFFRDQLQSATEAILFGMQQQLRAFPQIQSVNIADSHCRYLRTLLFLVLLWTARSLNEHTSSICQSVYFHTRALRHVCSALTEDTAAALAVTLVQSRLDYTNSILFETSTSNIKKLLRAQNTLARIILTNLGPLQLHLSYFSYTGCRFSHASDTNCQLLPINHCQWHIQPTCICYFSSCNPLDPFSQVTEPAGVAYIVIRVWQTCFQLLHTICLEHVTTIHPISQQFKLIQISSKNPSVCSSFFKYPLSSCHLCFRFKPCA